MMLSAAHHIGLQLCRDAFWRGDQCTWLGWAMFDDDDGEVISVWRAMGADLYRGTSGIALFLARLHTRAPEATFRETILGAMAQALATADDIDPAVALGLYTGRGGVGYAAVEIGQRLGRPDLTAAGLAMLEGLAEISLAPEMFDVISGAAGMIPALLSAAQAHRRPRLLAVAQRLGDFLVDLAGPEGGWRAHPEQRPLCGYSHGAAGVSLALAALSAATGAGHYAQAAEAGLAYERRLFHPPTGNWPDLRRPQEPAVPPTSCAWCHGAPGIGHARLGLLALRPQSAAAWQEVQAAVQTTAAAVSGALAAPIGDWSLCHGVFGNADLLIDAARALGRRDLLALAWQAGEHGLRTVAGQGLPWPTGNPGGTPTPGLMLGDAGVGLTLLRLSDGGQTPGACRIG